VIIGAVIFVFIYIIGSKNGGHSLTSALLLSVVYTLLFIPFQFMIDRFAYSRWQRRAGEETAKRSVKKR
jgi:hypothetical protein